MTASDFFRLLQEVAAAATVKEANEILAAVDPLDLSEGQIAALIDAAHDK